MKSFTAVAAVTVLLALSSTSIADTPPTLPPINVTANPCSYGVTCIFAPGMDAFLMEIPAYVPPAYDSIPVEDEFLIATCKSMRDRARQMGCDVNNPPPAPFYPSPTQGAWASNGCGDGSWKSALANAAIGAASLFTEDLTHPLPGVSFEGPCAFHDSCYYTLAKGFCDLRFGDKIRSDVCSGATGFVRAQCYALADLYQSTVEQLGQSAYDSNHRSMECAKIANALKNGDCAS